MTDLTTMIIICLITMIISGLLNKKYAFLCKNKDPSLVGLLVLISPLLFILLAIFIVFALIIVFSGFTILGFFYMLGYFFVYSS